MSRIMLIDASHAEQTRVVVTDKNRVVEFDIEALNKKQTIGNIYLAKVTRVEPSLQAAFIEYGEGRQGFLPFSEIHPDYYQIPVEDRKRLLEEEEERYRAENEARESEYSRSKAASVQSNNSDEDAIAFVEDGEAQDIKESSQEADEGVPFVDANSEEENDDIADSAPLLSDESEEAEEGEGNSSKKAAVSSARTYIPRQKRYKIQEVIKKRQILLVQVVKGERGNKGASLTTYLSLAGRYCVLMPNTAHGGGISRKINNAKERQYLKEVVSELDIIKGMGLIVRTAGASRTKVEIKRDYEYLLKMWNIIRDVTMNSVAPSLIYEEGNLIKRTIRDTYSRDIQKVFVQGRGAYEQARDFMKLLMPSQVRSIYYYNEAMPLFSKYNVEKQLEELTDNVVQLRSGGYLVINQTEALVAVDVNSGRSTNEFSVEDTALKTNLEAADEIARQLRMRDLAGLVVIDFIDMEDYRNIRSVERRMKDAIKEDRARIQMARISTFGLMEMTRQRLRPTMQDNLSNLCPHCKGTGHIVSPETGAIRVLRRIFEEIVGHRPASLTAKTEVSLANFILNKKRDMIVEFERKHNVSISIEGTFGLTHSDCEITTIARSHTDNIAIVRTGVVLDDALSDDVQDEVVEETQDNSRGHKQHNKTRHDKRPRQENSADDSPQESHSDGYFLNKRHKKPDNREGRDNRDNRDKRDRNGRFNKKHSRFSRYFPEPDVFVTEAGIEVVIENPVSVLQAEKVAEEKEFGTQVQDIVVSQEIPQEPQVIVEENQEEEVAAVKPRKKRERRVRKSDVANEENNADVDVLEAPAQQEEKQVTSKVKEAPVVLEAVKAEEKSMDDENTLVKDREPIVNIPEAANSTPIQETVEEPPKPARKGWWRDRFGI